MLGFLATKDMQCSKCSVGWQNSKNPFMHLGISKCD